MREPAIIRANPSGRLVKWPWQEPELATGELLGPLYYHEAIGVVVTRFNALELAFKHLVGMASGIRSGQIERVLLHVNATTLEKVLESIANDATLCSAVREELLFCVQLFSLCRENRNFLVHSAVEVSPLGLSLNGPGMHLTKRTSRGKLKIQHYRLAIETIRSVADEIHDAHQFFSTAIGPITHFDGADTLTLPHRPKLPDELHKVTPIFDLAAMIGNRALRAHEKGG